MDRIYHKIHPKVRSKLFGLVNYIIFPLNFEHDHNDCSNKSEFSPSIHIKIVSDITISICDHCYIMRVASVTTKYKASEHAVLYFR